MFFVYALVLTHTLTNTDSPLPIPSLVSVRWSWGRVGPEHTLTFHWYSSAWWTCFFLRPYRHLFVLPGKQEKKSMSRFPSRKLKSRHPLPPPPPIKVKVYGDTAMWRAGVTQHWAWETAAQAIPAALLTSLLCLPELEKIKIMLPDSFIFGWNRTQTRTWQDDDHPSIFFTGLAPFRKKKERKESSEKFHEVQRVQHTCCF